MTVETRDWVSSPFVWQRILSALCAVPLLSVGVIFLTTAAWGVITGRISLLAIWIGFPSMTLGLVFVGAAVLPVGRSRDGALTVAFVLFVSAWALAVVVPLLNALLIRGR